jgi:hypothetical protein
MQSQRANAALTRVALASASATQCLDSPAVAALLSALKLLSMSACVALPKLRYPMVASAMVMTHAIASDVCVMLRTHHHNAIAAAHGASAVDA